MPLDVRQISDDYRLAGIEAVLFQFSRKPQLKTTGVAQ